MDDYPGSSSDSNTNFQHNELIQFLTNSQEMRKTAKSSVKQSLYAGGGALAGSLTLGPVGGLVGGIAGSVIGFLRADDYDGAVLQILKLEGDRRERLVKQVGDVLTSAGATARQFETQEAFHDALLQFASQNNVRDQIWRACLDATRNDG